MSGINRGEERSAFSQTLSEPKSTSTSKNIPVDFRRRSRENANSLTLSKDHPKRKRLTPND